MTSQKTYDVRNIDAELASCDIKFKDQCKLVWEGMKKGLNYDGCTAVPDFDFGFDCCGEHDTYYQTQAVSRAEADKRLFQCILKKGVPGKILGISYNSNWFLATAYYLGVRAAGWAFWKSSFDRKNANASQDQPDSRS